MAAGVSSMRLALFARPLAVAGSVPDDAIGVVEVPVTVTASDDGTATVTPDLSIFERMAEVT